MHNFAVDLSIIRLLSYNKEKSTDKQEIEKRPYFVNANKACENEIVAISSVLLVLS